MIEFGAVLLLLLVLLPLATAATLTFFGKASRIHRRGGIAITLGQAALSLTLCALYVGTDSTTDTPIRFTTCTTWVDIPNTPFGLFHLDFFIGVDGISLLLLLMVTAGMSVAAAYTGKGTDNREQDAGSRKTDAIALLLLNAGIVGAIASLGLFQFVLFSGLTLLPLWGMLAKKGKVEGIPKRTAVRAITMLFAAEAVVLAVVAALYISSNVAPEGTPALHTFNIPALMQPSSYINGGILSPLNPGTFFGGGGLRVAAFVLLLVVFGMRLPIAPLHGWLRETLADAPPHVAMAAAVAFPALGMYGILRLCLQLFPEMILLPEVRITLGAIGATSVLYGALLAVAQKSMRGIIAVLPVCTGGIALMGIALAGRAGIAGGVIATYAGGLGILLLLLLATALQQRTGSTQLAEYGGLWILMPRFVLVLAIVVAALIGVPGFVAFTGLAPVLAGWIETSVAWGIVACAGLIVMAGVLVRLLLVLARRTLPLRDRAASLRDLTPREWLVVVPLLLLLVLPGILPGLTAGLLETTVQELMEHIYRNGSAITTALAGRAP